MSINFVLRAAGIVALALTAPLASAQDSRYSVLLDVDNRDTTGCLVDLGGGNIVDGIERRISARVPTASLQVAELTIETCTGVGFGPPQAVGGGYPVGLNSGTAGGDVVELGASVLQLTGLAYPQPMRLTFAAQSAAGSDVLATRAGGPIVFGLPAMPIPSLGVAGVLLLVISILVFVNMPRYRRLLRRASIGLVLASGVAVAANFALDGAIGDWAGVGPQATDPAGDSSSGQNSIDILAGFAAWEKEQLYFRIDVGDVQNNAPVANPGAQAALEDTALTIVLSGSDDQNSPLTFAIATPPTSGSVGAITPVSPNTAQVVYTPGADFNGADAFAFTVNDGDLGSPPATVSIAVAAVNDAPAFTGVNGTIYENGGAQSVSVAAAIVAGPPDESTQALTFEITANSNPGLFAIAPTIAADGTLTATPIADTLGSANLTVVLRDNGGTANGGIDVSAPQTIVLTIDDVNSPPTFTAGPNQSSAEDSGALTVANWATAISDGDTGTQALTFVVQANTNPGLFAVAPAISPTGTLSYTAAANATGTASITIVLQDNGGTVNGGNNTSPPATFTITVTPVNDAPQIDLNGPAAGTGYAADFVEGATPVAIVDAAQLTVGDIDSGTLASASIVITNPIDGASEVLAVNVGASGLVANFTGATLSLSGAATLATYQGVLRTATYANLSNNPDKTTRQITFVATDAEGATTTPPAIATIGLSGVNSPPTFTAGPNQSSAEDSGAQTVANWATAISDGDTGTQALTFVVQANTNPGLFAVAPAISPTGTLSYTAAANATGTASITIVLQDNGGTVNGGNNTSPPATFTITVTPVNDAPQIDLNGPAAGTGYAADFVEGATPVAIVDAAQLTVGDIDSGTLASASIVITNPIDGASEVLAVNVGASGLVANFTGATLSLSGAATLATYQGVLRTATYANLSNNPDKTTRQITFVATDAEGATTTPPAIATIGLSGVNSAPTFTAGANPNVFEDAAAQSVANWATAINDGDDGTQALTFVVQANSNPTLFAVAPAISPTGTLSYTLASNANGIASITIVLQDNGGTANGGSNTSTPVTFTVTVGAVNDAPVFSIPATAPSVLENAGAQAVSGFASAISAGAPDESGQALSFALSVTSTTGSLAFTTPPTMTASGTLSYTPQADTSGTATVQVILSDDGGTANGGFDTSTAQSFTVSVLGVNSAPTFTPGANVSVLEDSSAYSATWATAMDDGDLDATQALTFIVQGNTNPGLFTSAPAINATTGVLSFTPAANANGSADLTIVLQDDGGTANGGFDTSTAVTLTIALSAINDAPAFDLPASAPATSEDAGAQSVANFASNLSTGPANESAQALLGFTLTIDSADPTLSFSAAPTIALNGTLSYTAAANAFGTATITATLQDDGGTANGGQNSASHTFTLSVQPINDAPSFVAGSNPTVDEDSGAYSQLWASAINDGDGGTQVLTFNIISNSNPGLFSAGPAISAAGNLGFTPAANVFGVATLSVSLSDNGGTANGGTDTFGPVTLTITVAPVNDAPVVVAPTNVPVTRHIGIVIPAAHANGLLTNVSDPVDGAAAQPFVVSEQTNAPTSAGGRVWVGANGGWSYNPPASATVASDSFTFQVCDSGVPLPAACTTATTTITLSGNAVWFVDSSAAAGGDGTLARPFQTIDAAVTPAAANGRLFVFSGNHVGGATLLAGQLLIGQGVSVASATSFDAVFGLAPPPESVARPAIGGARPLVTTTVAASNGLNLASGNTIRGIEIGNTTGSALAGNGFGTLTLGDNRISGSGQALALATGTLAEAPTSTAFDQITSTSGANNIALSAIGGTADFGAGALSGAGGTALTINGGTASISYAGTVAAAASQRPVAITGKTGGTISLSGAVTSSALGIDLTTNIGATIRFSGGINLSTAASGAFNATGGGTVEVCDENPCNPAASGTLVNALTTTTGIALNVQNTMIGANQLEFRSISANGGANGIVLVSTGALGGLRVTGNGGTCVEGSTTCSGGWIRNMLGGDTSGSTPPGTGIVLANTVNVSLTRMRISDTSNYGIRGSAVAGFTFADGVVDGVHGTNATTPFNDGGLVFFGMTGASAITNSTIMGGRQRNIAIDNSGGTLTLGVTGNTIKRTSDAAGDDGFSLEADTTANVAVLISNNTFARHGGDHINLSMLNDAVVDATITNNVLHGNYVGTPEGNHPIGLGQGIFILGAAFNGAFTYQIANNGTTTAPFRGNRQGGAIHVNKGSGTATFSGTINNNVIGDPGLVGSGSAEAFGIIVGARGAGGSHTTSIGGNAIRQYFDRGAVLEAGEGTASLNATVTNNMISAFADAVNSLHGIHSDNGVLPADSNAVCLEVNSNLVANAGNEPMGGADLRLRRGSNTSVRLPGVAGATNANATTLWQANNPNATSISITGNGYTSGPACPQP